jgi:D-alanyl-lipoteichoic acid acyltransferase DltB (MBOAT superfamily)
VNYNQLAFWLLFAGLIAIYWRLGHRAQNRLLLVASYAFYGFWDYRFLFLILISTVIDFIGGLGVAGVRLARGRRLRLGGLVLGASLLLCANVQYPRLLRGEVLAALPHTLADLAIPLATLAALAVYGVALPFLYDLPERARRRWFVAVSMVANLAILGFFKYCDFFIDGFHALGAQLGLVSAADPPLLHIILPAGISFYTFQAMSYTIDIYRGECQPTTDFGDFALFVCFFPHLVAGPIMRAHTLLPQVLRDRRPEPRAFSSGLWLVAIGLFKKIAVADNMAPIANAVFYRLATGDTSALTGADVLVAIYAFAVQIYCDFSGYSAIARGISKWLGFELMINFRQPYLATTPSDFWRRWHISLSTWLRDYLYISLGGNRRGVRREYRNLMTTMLLGGLWHGASWTFVAWGGYHGAILCLFRALGVRDARPQDGVARYLVRLVLMFHLTCLGWLLFRADSFAAVLAALRLLGGAFHPTLAAVTPLVLIAFYAVALMLLELWLAGEERLARVLEAPWLVQGAILSYLIVMTLIFHAGRPVDFIYFQF